MRTWKDADGDLWAEGPQGGVVCVGEVNETTAKRLAGLSDSVFHDFADADEEFGPLVEVIDK